MLLPVIKLLMRNLFARAARHLGDETPELVIFNADTFGSLVVSTCVQSAPTTWSTFVLIAADAAMTGLSLHDINRCSVGLQQLESEIDTGPIWKRCRETVGHELLVGRTPTTFERASILLEREDYSTHRAGNRRAARVVPWVSSQQTNLFYGVANEGAGVAEVSDSATSRLASYITRTSTAWMGDSLAHLGEMNSAPGRRLPSSVQAAAKYTHRVRRMLYMAEFLLLLNYIEVVMPQIFGT
ncbi:unnamed protein product [Phytophthora fragariaefolia]|uniref:Unnamed protein product n=1 Tax=Phytophthora fragariaefolia TaxID=1490495 RepID=A0A9W6YGR5_9STRA|nr:unnamed protein product [Phytophthora fragariaefolia]